MSNTVEEIAQLLVDKADKEEIIFTRKEIVNNLMQLIFEQRVAVEDISGAVEEKAKSENHKKIFLYIANELVKYLAAKLTKGRLSSYRSAPKKMMENKVKLSKSEQFLERKRKEALEKESKDKKDTGAVEKIGLKEIGKEIQEHEDMMKSLDDKRLEQQKSTEEEHKKHTFAYQMAFEIFAHTVKVTAGENDNFDEICELIKNVGSVEITKRQIALDKMNRNSQSYLAVDALIASLGDKNILINVLNVLQKVGERRSIVPLINMIKEYPTSGDLMFRGPAERAIGETVRQMNEKEKSSGTKYIYQLCVNPKFEPTLRTMSRIISKDIANPKAYKEYFTPQCLKWISAVASKIAEKKKRIVKVGFVNVARPTELSKQLLEVVNIAKQKSN